MSAERFAAAERIADAVLYEGYVLYPYRASAAKNQFRWQFGVLAPRRSDDDGEPSTAHTECLIERFGHQPTVFVRVRFLRPVPGADPGSSWLEGVPHSIDLPPMDLRTLPITRTSALTDSGADVHITIDADQLGEFVKVRLTLESREPWHEAFASDRDAMLRRSLVGAHLLLATDEGAFVSLLEPPPQAESAVADCKNRHTWPVLVGDRARRDLLLSSPIVLYDYPAVAAESQGDLCDSAEIDEILSLRIMTMTDAEKQEARATDPRAKAILDRIDAMSPDALSALHGTMRNTDFFNPPGAAAPDKAFVMVGHTRVEKGSHVRLRPNRRADAMDMFLRDQAATVAGVYRDVDDRVHVAVTVDADPGAAMHESFGRYFYFDPAEIEPIEAQERI